MNKRNLKSIWAVVAGVFVIVLLSIGTDVALNSLVYGYTEILIIPLIYRTIYAVIGGYVCAMLAPQNPKKHVLILNIIGAILGTLGAIGNWGLGNHWYPISLVITSVIGVWFGGVVQIKHRK